MTVKLREYQWDAVTYLAACAADGHRMLGLNTPTGSGKTVILVGFLRKTRFLFTGAVLAGPSEQVEANFHKDWDIEAFPPPVGPGCLWVARFKTQADVLFRRLRDTADKREYFDQVVRPGKVIGPWVALTTHKQLVDWGIEALPADLTGKLLILDEAHHAGTGEGKGRDLIIQIGAFAAAWLSRGGTILYVTATPFRTDGKIVFPDGTQAFVWSITEHAAKGYAPNNFQRETHVLQNVKAVNAAEMFGEQLNEAESEHGVSYEEIVERWVADGRPKLVCLVPQGVSRRWERGLLDAFQGVPNPPRVHSAVGDDNATGRALAKLLTHEQQVTRYEDSQVDVILACKRFDEGTDWPLCSHVYRYGIPRSFGLIVQQWGRAFRDKKGIAGYPPEHIETAKMVFFVPRLKDEVLPQFVRENREYTWILACYMANWEAAREISTAMRISFEKHFARMPRRTVVDRIASEQATLVPDEVRAKMRAVIGEFVLRTKHETGLNPQASAIIGHLDSLTLTEMERQAAEEILLDFTLKADKDAQKKLDEEMGGLAELQRLERHHIRQLFRRVIAEFSDKTYVDSVVENAITIHSEFTGEDAGTVARRVAGSPSVNIPDEQVVQRVIHPYIAQKGRPPDPLGSDQDVSNLLGIPVTLLDIDRMLRRRGLDLPRLIAARGWVDAPPIDLDLVHARLAPHRRRLPVADSYHWATVALILRAVRDPKYDLRKLGLRENLVGLAMAFQFGWRGLSKGSNLYVFLDRPDPSLQGTAYRLQDPPPEEHP